MEGQGLDSGGAERAWDYKDAGREVVKGENPTREVFPEKNIECAP